VARYFPLPGHANALNAAVAAEAAAQQGAFEAMYQEMYETQTQWGEQQDSKATLFRSFAQELGLDMAAYDAAVADPATLERVLSDRDDGLALGVEGTPTFSSTANACRSRAPSSSSS
jgi:predicted DsbA family dithiol-disulfide isomerase